MVEITLFNTGYCTAPGKLTDRRHSWRTRTFPALVALLQHPSEGYILFDTGYSPRFFDATRAWPYCLYRWTTPVHHQPEQAIVRQLALKGIQAEEITAVFISHFHGDHSCGLLDFPVAQIICSRAAAEEATHLKGFSAVRKGILPQLIPSDLMQRARLLEEENTDLFGDGSLIAIPLPGHARGQMGLLVEQSTFFVADAAWSSDAIRENTPPHPVVHLIHDDKEAYTQQFQRLHEWQKREPSLRMIPSHCHEALL